LAEFLERGSQLKTLCLRQPPIPTFSCKEQINEWYGKTAAYLSQNLEPAYRARFESAAGNTLMYGNVSQEDNGYINALVFKSVALDEFLKELRD
jgi:hypothetical protein